VERRSFLRFECKEHEKRGLEAASKEEPASIRQLVSKRWNEEKKEEVMREKDRNIVIALHEWIGSVRL
jgi:hypothetical protein